MNKIKTEHAQYYAIPRKNQSNIHVRELGLPKDTMHSENNILRQSLHLKKILCNTNLSLLVHQRGKMEETWRSRAAGGVMLPSSDTTT